MSMSVDMDVNGAGCVRVWVDVDGVGVLTSSSPSSYDWEEVKSRSDNSFTSSVEYREHTVVSSSSISSVRCGTGTGELEGMPLSMPLVLLLVDACESVGCCDCATVCTSVGLRGRGISTALIVSVAPLEDDSA